MPVYEFPDPSTANEDGIVAVGGDLDSITLQNAYRSGIFPWPIDDYPYIPWFCPEKRAILEYEHIHIPKSLQKFLKKVQYKPTINKAFVDVIEFCAKVPRKGQGATWINSEMLDAYKRMHEEGFAHSIEVWDSSNGRTELVGGLYGVSVDGCFSGESMFSLKDNASKVALLYLMEHVHQNGLDWIDIQMLTPHLEMLGARELTRESFLRKLKEAQDSNRRLF